MSRFVDQDPEFDEEPFRKVAEGLTARRALLVQMIEDQMRSIQTVYDDLDGKMAQFGKAISRLRIQPFRHEIMISFCATTSRCLCETYGSRCTGFRRRCHRCKLNRFILIKMFRSFDACARSLLFRTRARKRSERQGMRQAALRQRNSCLSS